MKEVFLYDKKKLLLFLIGLALFVAGSIYVLLAVFDPSILYGSKRRLFENNFFRLIMLLISLLGFFLSINAFFITAKILKNSKEMLVLDEDGIVINSVVCFYKKIGWVEIASIKYQPERSVLLVFTEKKVNKGNFLTTLLSGRWHYGTNIFIVTKFCTAAPENILEKCEQFLTSNKQNQDTNIK